MGHYEVLGVPPGATAAELRRAYLELARRHHPDLDGGSAEQMRAVNEAWATLGDADRRRRYDESLRPPSSPGSAPWSYRTPPDDTWAGDRAEHLVDDVIDDLLDDRPIHGGMVRLPRWVAMLPPGLLVGAFLAGLFGVVLRLPAVVGLALMLGVLSVMFFLASPFIALAASRRGTGSGHRGGAH